MTLLIILTVLTTTAVVLVAARLGRPHDRSPGARAAALAIAEDQIDDVERKRKTDVRHDSFGSSGSTKTKRDWRVGAAMVVSSLAVLGSVGLYGVNGSRQPAVVAAYRLETTAVDALRQLQSDQRGPLAPAGNVDALVKRLEVRLEANSNDPDGWRVLGWSYYNMERYRDAAEAYRRSAELDGKSAILKSLYGEALVKSAGGKVTAKAGEIFEAALVLNPNEVRARYFTGLAMEQNGDPQGALDAWIALLKTAPSDVDWARDLRQRIITLAAMTRIDIKSSLPEPVGPSAPLPAQATGAPKGPTAEDIKNAEQMSQSDRMAMIRGMVDRLARRLKDEPVDPEGWIRLMHSRLVLNDPEAAHGALSDALQAFVDRPQTQRRIKDAAAALGLMVN